jgi:hypothetical protein
MDKRSFMRGFGVGVLFATIILGVSCLIRTSDAAVMKRAKALGMTYQTEEEPLFQTSEPTSESAVTKSKKKSADKTEATAKPKTKATAKPTEKPSKTVAKEDADSSDLTKASEDAAAEMEEASRELTITAGEWSDSVSRDLEALDIISDATEFDTYLEENGYSDDIKAGTFNISLDATFEEIAKEITQ